MSADFVDDMVEACETARASGFAAGRLAGLREAAAWHALKAAHYERQVHDTFGKGEFHTDAARAILALAEGGEG